MPGVQETCPRTEMGGLAAQLQLLCVQRLPVDLFGLLLRDLSRLRGGLAHEGELRQLVPGRRSHVRQAYPTSR